MAQKGVIKEFSAAELPAMMLEHLNQATSDKEKQKANQQLIVAFEKVYANMDNQTQGRVTGISNVLLKLRVKQLPDVYNFVSTLTAFYNINAKDDNFDQWLASIEYIQQRNKKVKDFTDFIEFTDQFLKDRTLCRTRAALWQTQQGLAFKLELRGNDIVLSFPKPFELYYSSDKDNGTIYGTTGEYYYFDNKWVGHGGRLNWDRTGIPSAQCWAVLKHYEAITKFPKFTADSVLFTNTKYFTEPVLGRVEEQLSSPMEPEKYAFPKFRSYQKDFSLKDILPGVDYRGSFMMNGSKFVTSDATNPATMVFYRNGARFLTVQSPKFTITASRIVSENAAVKMYLGTDSICNNGILVRYIASDKQVTLVNDSKRNYYSPYSNSYHNLDMYCENMVWKMDQDILDFSMLTGTNGSQNFSTFESNSYYSEMKYRQIQAQDEVSPVMRVFKYVQLRGFTYDFFVDEFAQHIHMDIMQAKSMVHNLARHGLVSYDEATGKVYVKDKLVDYAHAFAKDKNSNFDYDALVFESNAKGSNAVLDLSTNDILMHGVEKFVLSDSQQVVIYPRGGDMVMHKNRDIEFSGRVNAGRFVSYVTNARFLYEDFRIDLPQVDSMYFYVTNFNDPQKEHIVYTPLYNLVGFLQIDSSNNHCGLHKTHEKYPIFTSTQDCYVYYDRADIHNGTYVRDRFYYTINPFKVKDMVDFKTDELEFNGYLTSAGIFPVIKEPLKVQRDYSLGFEIETPRSGFPAYGGKGTFKEQVKLSYQGFRGEGTLTYLSATIASKQMLFTPDSMRSVSDTFFVKEDATFPQISNSRCVQHWFPYEDSMRVVQSAKGPEFRMFRGDASLAGYVTLRPAGANARGAITIGEGTITSQHFALRPRMMDAQVSHFVLRSDIYKSIAFEANNMKSHTDYDKRYAEFTSNAPIERTLMPLLQYAAYVDKFAWQFDKKELDLLNSQSESTLGLEGIALRERLAHPQQPGARFVSTDPKRDSLQFHSVRASYLYNEGQLSCKSVFLLHSADAVIAPGGDSLHIRQGGQIDLLKHSQLLASSANRYHLIYDADLLVEGAKHYSGKGTIDYVDEHDKHQKILLTEIAPNSKGMTIGKGFIPDSANFTLNEAFGFAGSVRVEADSVNYFFDGGVRLLHNCAPTEQLGLLAYASFTDPKMVLVSVPELPTDWKGNRITASMLFDRSTLEPRNAFLTNERAADNELMTAHGLLHYDSETGAYTISSRQKIEDPDNTVARYLSLDTKACTLSGEGPIDFNQRSNFVNLFCYGISTLDTKHFENTELNSILGFTFPIDEKVLTTMEQLISEDLRLSPSNPDNEVVRHAMMYYMGADAGADNYSTYVTSGFYDKLPKEFENTLLFEGIRWHYSPTLGYYYSGMAGLAAIGKKQLHLNTRVKAQLYKRGSGVYLILYIQVAADHWYYFNYEFNSQTLNIYSSAGEWLDMIKAIPADKRTVNGKSDQGSYRYRVGSSRTEVQNFLLRIDGTNPNAPAYDDEEEEEDIPNDDE
ncbi:MAG: hypothetical protein HUK17_02375 [Bacteroidales bacterium]|nr:hypothetical protein [Bacteroidales bacterium]